MTLPASVMPTAARQTHPRKLNAKLNDMNAPVVRVFVFKSCDRAETSGSTGCMSSKRRVKIQPVSAIALMWRP
jgi:hypothetical protein